VAEEKPEQDINGDGEIEEVGSPKAEASGDGLAGEPGDNPGDAGAPEGEISPQERIAALEEELSSLRDLALRSQADAQNTKRRADQEVEKARKYALERFVSELLPVVDNLERALDSAGGDDEILRPITEGVELTLKSFREALKRFNVEAIDPTGEPFDPNMHQAMSMVENPDVEPNSVIAVMQKGYTLNGRLVRPAMVMVSKAAQG
jgi:molecular chaperone GrpE